LYDRPINGKPAPDPSGMKRVALHAVVLGLVHPVTGKTMRWTSALPDDMARLLGELRGTR
jgi:23S rRNA pseudouridine1911/1915/1917 synthase